MASRAVSIVRVPVQIAFGEVGHAAFRTREKVVGIARIDGGLADARHHLVAAGGTVHEAAQKTSSIRRNSGEKCLMELTQLIPKSSADCPAFLEVAHLGATLPDGSDPD